MVADEDDVWRRRRQREDEEEAEKQKEESIKLGVKPNANISGKLDLLIHQSEALIEQLDRLYSIYFQGLERLPPVQKRKLLDETIEQLDREAKATPQDRFKSQTVRTKYSIYRERWDKKLRDLEEGKIKRG